MANVARWTVILAFATLLTHCSRPIVKQDLAGRYSAQIGDQSQILEVYPGGKYENSFFVRGKLMWRYRDAWTYGYENTMNSDAITFQQFWLGFQGYDVGSPGYWIEEPSRDFSGLVALCFDPDLPQRCFFRDARQGQ